jgi:hypothetical protein
MCHYYFTYKPMSFTSFFQEKYSVTCQSQFLYNSPDIGVSVAKPLTTIVL